MPAWGLGHGRWAKLLAEQAEENGRLYFRLAYRIVKDASAAEDACQQALLKAMNQGEQINDPGKLRAWLSQIVVRESLQLARKRGAEERRIGRLAPVQTSDQIRGEAEALQRAVAEGLDALDPQIRVVVVLRVLEGYSGNQVKELLNCSAADVSRRLHSGLAQLRPLLGEWKDG